MSGSNSKIFDASSFDKDGWSTWTVLEVMLTCLEKPPVFTPGFDDSVKIYGSMSPIAE